jgi:hypothetical protein
MTVLLRTMLTGAKHTWCPVIALCRHLASEFGPNWRIPEPGDHGTMVRNPDIWDLNNALTNKLSVTAWGGMPYPERWARCKDFEVRKAARKAAPRDVRLQQLQ